MSILTGEELQAARDRLRPYVGGYPQPMVDARRLRKANGTASVRDLREIAAEDAVLRDLRLGVDIDHAGGLLLPGNAERRVPDASFTVAVARSLAENLPDSIPVRIDTVEDAQAFLAVIDDHRRALRVALGKDPA